METAMNDERKIKKKQDNRRRFFITGNLKNLLTAIITFRAEQEEATGACKAKEAETTSEKIASDIFHYNEILLFTPTIFFDFVDKNFSFLWRRTASP